MTVADKTEALRKVLIRYSRKDWDWICDYGVRTKWCRLGLLVAKRELGMTWKEAGACFGISPKQASSVARRFEIKVLDEPGLFDLFNFLAYQVQESLDHTCLFRPDQSEVSEGPPSHRG